MNAPAESHTFENHQSPVFVNNNNRRHHQQQQLQHQRQHHQDK